MTTAETHSPPLISIKLLVGFCVLFAVLKTSAVVITIVSIGLCLWTLIGVKQAVQALSLFVIIKHLNPVLYSFSGEFGILAWLTLILAGTRVIFSSSLKYFKPLIPLFIFSFVVALLTTVQTNKFSDISLMKLFIFTYGATTLLIAFQAMPEEDFLKIRTWMFTLSATVLLLSLPLLAFPAIGYARNGSGFQGITSHPQVFGPMFAPILSWVLTELLFTQSTQKIKTGITSLALIIIMMSSRARTSIVATFITLFLSFLILFFNSQKFKDLKFTRSIGLSLLGGILLILALAFSSGLRHSIEEFVFKQQEKSMEGALSSRGAGIATQWYYFTTEPLIGHGFGVYSWGEFPSDIVRVFGIPISAPVEKGFMPTAVLEEVGILGAIPLLYFLVTLTKMTLKRADPRYLGLFLACLFVNVGEMIFFSLGGIGLYYWVYIGLSTRPPAQIRDIKAKKPVFNLVETSS